MIQLLGFTVLTVLLAILNKKIGSSGLALLMFIERSL